MHPKIKLNAKSGYILVSILLFLVSSCTVTQTIITPTAFVPAIATPTVFTPPLGAVEYKAQSGDTLASVALRFGVSRGQVTSPDPIPSQGLLEIGQRLYLPAYTGETTSSEVLFPDSEVVYSPSVASFDLPAFVESTNGKLKKVIETVFSGPATGAAIVNQLVHEYSINPRLLLTLLEFNSHYVTNFPTKQQSTYPMGYLYSNAVGLRAQTIWASEQLMAGYYGWRAGSLTTLVFPDRTTLRLSPTLNAGTVAVMYLLAQTRNRTEWEQALEALPRLHAQLFGDYWARAKTVEPLFPNGLQQTELRLPFPRNEVWNYTCGPHPAWGENGQPLAALDFAPPLDQPGCGVSSHWTTAMASGLILRTENGAVIQDLDGDGVEQTGWVLLYMHVSSGERILPGQKVLTGDRIGHPSCEGGTSSGTHVHVARKYNGEWVLADGGLPFMLSGYQAGNLPKFCEGTLTRGEVVVHANAWGSYITKICQPDSTDCEMSTPTPRPTFTPKPIPTLRPTPTPKPTKTPKPTYSP